MVLATDMHLIFHSSD